MGNKIRNIVIMHHFQHLMHFLGLNNCTFLWLFNSLCSVWSYKTNEKHFPLANEEIFHIIPFFYCIWHALHPWISLQSVNNCPKGGFSLEPQMPSLHHFQSIQMPWSLPLNRIKISSKTFSLHWRNNWTELCILDGFWVFIFLKKNKCPVDCLQKIVLRWPRGAGSMWAAGAAAPLPWLYGGSRGSTVPLWKCPYVFMRIE